MSRIKNKLLFVYPVIPYFEPMGNTVSSFYMDSGASRPYVSKLMDIIDLKYRDKGFDINWLLFGTKKDLSKPDLSLVPSSVRINKQDKVISSGISWYTILGLGAQEFCIGFNPSKIYQVSGFLDDLIPLEKLVLGGFHEFDCVKAIKKAAIKKRIPTKIDPEITQRGYKDILKKNNKGEIRFHEFF